MLVVVIDIGWLIVNMVVYLFDMVGELVFVGVIGLLWIGGWGLVDGYYDCLVLMVI